MAMMAMTTSSSISVNPRERHRAVFIGALVFLLDFVTHAKQLPRQCQLCVLEHREILPSSPAPDPRPPIPPPARVPPAPHPTLRLPPNPNPNPIPPPRPPLPRTRGQLLPNPLGDDADPRHPGPPAHARERPNAPSTAPGLEPQPVPIPGGQIRGLQNHGRRASSRFRSTTEYGPSARPTIRGGRAQQPPRASLLYSIADQEDKAWKPRIWADEALNVRKTVRLSFDTSATGELVTSHGRGE